ncbi:MAG TPA: hypothetical protein VNF72_01725, partial [Myxococcota bacterium]|nr:hypothetical protein [Myxococcota bacterium]
MREGPLAALFRKTDEDDAKQPAPAPRAEEQPRSEPPRTEPPARRTEFLPPEAPPSPSGGDRAPAAEHSEPEYEPAREVPSPRERLRHAFSHDIPDNILDRQVSTRDGDYGRPAARPRVEPEL